MPNVTVSHSKPCLSKIRGGREQLGLGMESSKSFLLVPWHPAPISQRNEGLARNQVSHRVHHEAYLLSPPCCSGAPETFLVCLDCFLITGITGCRRIPVKTSGTLEQLPWTASQSDAGDHSGGQWHHQDTGPRSLQAVVQIPLCSLSLYPGAVSKPVTRMIFRSGQWHG